MPSSGKFPKAINLLLAAQSTITPRPSLSLSPSPSLRLQLPFPSPCSNSCCRPSPVCCSHFFEGKPYIVLTLYNICIIAYSRVGAATVEDELTGCLPKRVGSMGMGHYDAVFILRHPGFVFVFVLVFAFVIRSFGFYLRFCLSVCFFVALHLCFLSETTKTNI